MKAYVIGSGSKGNSTLIISSNTKILIDVGFSFPYMKMMLNQIHVDINSIDGIIITHSHKDHVLGLASVAKRCNIKIYANYELYNDLRKIVEEDNLVLVEESFSIGNISISTIPTSHDAVGSVGFIINDDNNNMVYITDTGYLSQKNLDLIHDKNLYIMESNHDIEMLMSGPYPYILKQRVVGDKGHLSNEMCGNYLQEIMGLNTKKVVLAHLSETNNTKELAYDTVNNIIQRDDIVLMVAEQRTLLEVGEF